MKGQLRDNPLAEMIREISAERLTGALRLAHARVKAVVYFHAGRLVSARSNLRQHRLSEAVRHWNVVAPDRLDAMLTETMTDGEVGAALTAAGLLSVDEVNQLQTRLSDEVLRHAILWMDGEWDFDARGRPGERNAATINVGQLLIEGVRRLPTEFAAARLPETDETIAPAVLAESANVQLTPTEAFVLTRVDAPMTVSELVSMSGVPAPEACRVIYALALGGLLTREQWPRAFSADDLARCQAPDKARAASINQVVNPATDQATRQGHDQTNSAGAATEPQDEINLLLARAGGENHYAVLGVERGAAANEIKRAYYALAKRFHPDRFHQETADGQRARIESAFAKISQAYEALSDTNKRTAYDHKLNTQSKTLATSPTPSRIASDASPKSSPEATPQTAPKIAPHAADNGPPPRAEQSFQKGVAALNQGDHNLAAQCFDEAARLMPQQSRYRAYYGRALAANPRTRRQAETELLAAIKLDSGNMAYRVMLAELYRDIGLHRRAVNELESALTINPQFAAARTMLDALKKAEGKT
ncbi:MAG: DnaJ domain-containing protein [Acidobacteriota bacterium]|nr:DnaJ domain-containing protein [Acidobacteriota bacterium]